MDMSGPENSHSANAVSEERGGTRNYRYNRDDLNQLFATIIQALSEPDKTGEVIGRILTDVCVHFHFGCGFVYETDHTGTFNLKEMYSGYTPHNLPATFKLERHLGMRDIEKLLKTSVFYQHCDADQAPVGKTNLFDSNTFLMVPVLNRERQPIGLVGMMDRRRNILSDNQAVDAAKTVFNLIANSIKLRLYQKRLQFAQQSLVSILDNTGLDIYVNDFRTHEILYLNKSMAAPYGGRQKLLGKKCWEALYTDKTGPCEYCPQKKLIDADGNPTKVHSWDYRRPFDGSWFRVLSAAFRWTDGRLAHVVSSVDITENKNNEATIAQLANYDSLTMLPNRRKLFHDCRTAIDQASAAGGHGYLVFFDLDNFKSLNDTMGHQAGDQLLQQIGRALQKNPHTKSRCYRYGGDEFIILLPNCCREAAEAVIQDIRDRFIAHQASGDWELSMALGLALKEDESQQIEELITQADNLMYQDKRNNRRKR